MDVKRVLGDALGWLFGAFVIVEWMLLFNGGWAMSLVLPKDALRHKGMSAVLIALYLVVFAAVRAGMESSRSDSRVVLRQETAEKLAEERCDLSLEAIDRWADDPMEKGIRDEEARAIAEATAPGVSRIKPERKEL